MDSKNKKKKKKKNKKEKEEGGGEGEEEVEKEEAWPRGCQIDGTALQKYICIFGFIKKIRCKRLIWMMHGLQLSAMECLPDGRLGQGGSCARRVQ